MLSVVLLYIGIPVVFLFLVIALRFLGDDGPDNGVVHHSGDDEPDSDPELPLAA